MSSLRQNEAMLREAEELEARGIRRTEGFWGLGELETCPYCGLRDETRIGPDPCLGWIVGQDVEHACCGHGYMPLAYVLFRDRSGFRGEAALRWFNEHAWGRPGEKDYPSGTAGHGGERACRGLMPAE